MRLSSCGIDCDICEIGKEKNCAGCYSMKGKPFWSGDGVCDLFACAIDKKHPNCGKCEGFPCDKLKEWAYSESGENGLRIENLRMMEVSPL
ncbi:MAG: DUF3795 domain-containing protein [Lachnospiraceae bacterium]|jgi:hypothetical protein|nr:DUF3795 domain-containing protein [Lachnospiraceae bacterium]